MAVAQTKTTTLGIACPKCALRTPETVGVLFANAELKCFHCGSAIDISSGPARKYIAGVYDACQSADEA